MNLELEKTITYKFKKADITNITKSRKISYIFIN